MIVVICGVSGAGKTTIVDGLLELLPVGRRIESYTTRPSRKTDPSGEYVYISEEEFERLDSIRFFLWTVGPFGSKYGTARSSVKAAVGKKNGIDVMTVVPETAVLLKNFTDSLGGVDIMYFYILSPGLDILRRRLSKPERSNEDIEKRIRECINLDDWAKKEYLAGRIPFIFLTNDKEGDIIEPINYIFSAIIESIRNR